MAAHDDEDRAARARQGAPQAGPGGAGPLKSRFDAVYRQNAWGDDESASGAGSRLDSHCVAATEEALEAIIAAHAVATIADAPCGDFNWMRRFLSRHPEIGYEGLDIVEDLVLENRRLHGPHRFSCADLTATVPPRVDLILCKDLVNHLANEDVCRVLHNFRASGSGLLLLSNNEGWTNEELPAEVGGMSRHLDVTRPPFSLPPPIWQNHYLALWRVDQIPREFVLPAVHHPGTAGAEGDPSAFLAPGLALMDATPPRQVFCGRDRTGIALFGPYARARAGRYRASFRLHCVAPDAASLREPFARVEVTADHGDAVLCDRTVAPADLAADPRVMLDFELASERVLELRVDLFGRQDAIVDFDRHLVRLERRFVAPD